MMKANDTFRTSPYMHNCAQAIAYRWVKYYPEGKEIVDIYAPLTGGRAPQGLCGALYAAMQAAPSFASQIKEEFIQKVGASSCREIKTTTKTPCPVCVATADRLLEKYLLNSADV